MSDAETTDLIEELRSVAKIFKGRLIWSTLTRAADALATKIAEIERLTRERDHWQATHAAERLASMNAEARATAAEAKAERLWEELSLIAVIGDSHDPAVCSAIAYHAVKRARAALTEGKP